MAIEFGVRKGLAIRLPDQSRQIAYRGMRMRQAAIDAENKAKMFADDMEYTNVMNSHDNPLVKEYATNQIRTMGKFMTENPGWESNPMARVVYNQLRHNLKDNPELNRGMTSDANYKAWQKYIQDPKNSDMRDDPALLAVNQQWNNYLKFGHQEGEAGLKRDGGKREFTFMAPEELVDTTSKLIELAQKTEYDDIKNFGYQNSGLRSEVSSARKDLTVQHALGSTWGKYLKKDYDKYVDQLVGNEKTNAQTLNQFVRQRMEPYFQSEKIDRAYQVPVLRARGSGGVDGMNRSIWLNMHNKALSVPGQKIDFGAEAMQFTFANKLGEHNLDGVKDPFGNVVDLGLRKAQATGLGQPQRGPDNSVYAEYDALVRMPVKDFQNLGPKYNEAIDEGGLGQFTPGPSSSKDWDVWEEYKALGIEQYTDEAGNKFVQFPIRQKYDPNNVHLSDNYANAHNISPHKEDPYAGIADGQEAVVSDDGKWAWNGTSWVPTGR